MREIKFRVYVEGYGMSCFTLADLDSGVLVDGATGPGDVSDPVMQYTGLKDKFGTEIYEGDLVTGVYESSAGLQREIGPTEVKYVMGTFGISTKDGWQVLGLLASTLDPPNQTLTEVVGNIYENPELIEAEVV